MNVRKMTKMNARPVGSVNFSSAPVPSVKSDLSMDPKNVRRRELRAAKKAAAIS